MVQGYAQTNTPDPSVWSSDFGNQGGYFEGSNPFQRFGPYSCNHQHEQRCVCQTEELKLREPFEIRGLRKHTLQWRILRKTDI